MKVLLVSTHIDQTTGYSKVASALIKQLAALHPTVKTYHFGFQRHPARSNLRKVPDGVIAYDAAANEDPKEEGFGFNKIHEYLEKQGIRSMDDQGGRRIAFHRKPNRKVANRKKRAPKDNEHMSSVLEDYSEMTADAFKKK
jgi:hypothetical protein